LAEEIFSLVCELA